MKTPLSGFFVVLFFTLIASAQDWPEYRGPTADGLSQSTGLPLEWSESRNVSWKTAIHGRAWSSPVVFGDQVWLTTATEDGTSLFVLCLDRSSGEILLDRRIFAIPQPRPLGNSINSYATPSPVIEDGRVYVHFGSYGTAALDTSTFETVWLRQDLPCDHWRGPASSPILWEDLIILTMDGANVQYIAALDKSTGRNRWVAFRSADYGDLGDDGRPKLGGDMRKAYNTPFVISHGGREQLISPAAKAAYAYDPRTGREIWHVRHGGHSSATRPLYLDGIVAVNTGYVGSDHELWGVRVDGEGDVTESHVAWKYRRGSPRRSSPVLVDGRLYMISDKGVATCVDFATGREIWKGRIGGNHSASAIFADGRIHFSSEEGVSTLIRPGNSLDILATNRLDGGFMASPAVAGSSLFLRSKTHLYRIDDGD